MGAENKDLPGFRYFADADEAAWESYRAPLLEQKSAVVPRRARAKVVVNLRSQAASGVPVTKDGAEGRPRIGAGATRAFRAAPSPAPSAPSIPNRPDHSPPAGPGWGLVRPAAVAGLIATLIAAWVMIQAPREPFPRTAGPPRQAVLVKPAGGSAASPEPAQAAGGTLDRASPPANDTVNALVMDNPTAAAQPPRRSDAGRHHRRRWTRHRSRRAHKPSARRRNEAEPLGVQIDRSSDYPDQTNIEQAPAVDKSGPYGPPD